MTFAEWTAEVRRDGGTATTVPSNVPPDFQQYAGYPAARYSNALYVTLVNAGQVDPGAPSVASNAGTYVYVVAPQDVWSTAPHTMTTGEQIANAVFSSGDAAANAVGLGGLGDFLRDTGKQILIGVAVTVAVAYALKRKS
jgi:hypothetical protein